MLHTLFIYICIWAGCTFHMRRHFIFRLPLATSAVWHGWHLYMCAVTALEKTEKLLLIILFLLGTKSRMILTPYALCMDSGSIRRSCFGSLFSVWWSSWVIFLVFSFFLDFIFVVVFEHLILTFVWESQTNPNLIVSIHFTYTRCKTCIPLTCALLFE